MGASPTLQSSFIICYLGTGGDTHKVYSVGSLCSLYIYGLQGDTHEQE